MYFQIKMLCITRRDKTKHYFYTPEEATERGIKWSAHWKTGQPSDWVLSDNNYIGQVLKRYEYKEKNKKQNTNRILQHVVFANGTFRTDINKFIATDRAIDVNQTINARMGLFCETAINTNFNWKAAYELAFAEFLHLQEYFSFNRIIRRLNKSPKCRRILMQKLSEKFLDNQKITLKWLFDKYVDIVESNDKTINGGHRIEALKTLTRLYGVNPDEPFKFEAHVEQITGKKVEDAVFTEKMLPEETRKLIANLDDKDNGNE